MAKKYRLEINYDEITDDNFDEVARMRDAEVNGTTCEYETDSKHEGADLWHFGDDGCFQIKKSWLTEIKEQSK